MQGILIKGDYMLDQNRTQYQYLGLNIAYYRKKCHMSQSQLAEKINISRTHMSRIETAECAVSLDVVFELCKVFNISPKEIFDFRI